MSGMTITIWSVIAAILYVVTWVAVVKIKDDHTAFETSMFLAYANTIVGIMPPALWMTLPFLTEAGLSHSGARFTAAIIGFAVGTTVVGCAPWIYGMRRETRANRAERQNRADEAERVIQSFGA